MKSDRDALLDLLARLGRGRLEAGEVRGEIRLPDLVAEVRIVLRSRAGLDEQVRRREAVMAVLDLQPGRADRCESFCSSRKAFWGKVRCSNRPNAALWTDETPIFQLVCAAHARRSQLPAVPLSSRALAALRARAERDRGRERAREAGAMAIAAWLGSYRTDELEERRQRRRGG